MVALAGHNGAGKTTLLNLLVGGPMVARELETGTFRLSWIQGCGRTRWLLARFLLFVAAVTAGAAAVSVMFSWYYQPMLQLGQDSPLAPQVFDLGGVDFAAWTLAAFAISVCARGPHPAHDPGHRGGAGGPAVVRRAGLYQVLHLQPASRFWHFQLIEGG